MQIFFETSKSFSSERLRMKSIPFEIFSRICCEDLVRDQIPYQIPLHSTVQEASKILFKSNHECAPIEGSTLPNLFLNIFSFRSLSDYLLQNFSKFRAKKLSRSKSLSMLRDSGFDLRLLAFPSIGPERKVHEFIDFGIPQCQENERATAVINLFCKKLEKVAIMDTNGNYKGMVSQEMVLKHFVTECGNMHAVFTESIGTAFPETCSNMVHSISEKVNICTFELHEIIFLWLSSK